MLANTKLLEILTILNLLAAVFWWCVPAKNLEINTLERMLEELSEKKPHFFVSLLNKAANESIQNEGKNSEEIIFQRRTEILKAGFNIKTYAGPDQKDLIIFADLTDANSIMYLQNVQKALAAVRCSVHIIPISVFGKKSNEQAQLIWAATLQSPQKAFQLALTYNAVIDAENDMVAEAKNLGLDPKKLLHDQASKQVREVVAEKIKLAESLEVGSLSIFLLTTTEAHILPPVESKDLPDLISSFTTS